jgi:hypothetical protein
MKSAGSGELRCAAVSVFAVQIPWRKNLFNAGTCDLLLLTRRSALPILTVQHVPVPEFQLAIDRATWVGYFIPITMQNTRYLRMLQRANPHVPVIDAYALLVAPQYGVSSRS